jgi:hypothetical protein
MFRACPWKAALRDAACQKVSTDKTTKNIAASRKYLPDEATSLDAVNEEETCLIWQRALVLTVPGKGNIMCTAEGAVVRDIASQ